MRKRTAIYLFIFIYFCFKEVIEKNLVYHLGFHLDHKALKYVIFIFVIVWATRRGLYFLEAKILSFFVTLTDFHTTCLKSAACLKRCLYQLH